MRRQFPAASLYWLTAGLMFFVSAADANVIYDVEVNYDGGYKYSFAMEFATIKSEYRESDLIPNGDFQNKRFSRNGTEWALTTDQPPFFLGYIPAFPQLTVNSNDRFTDPISGDVAWPHYADYMLTLYNPAGQVSYLYAPDDPVVVERQPDGIPEPASVTLLGLGLAGLAGMRRRAKKQSSPALILHDTNAASA